MIPTSQVPEKVFGYPRELTFERFLILVGCFLIYCGYPDFNFLDQAYYAVIIGGVLIFVGVVFGIVFCRHRRLECFASRFRLYSRRGELELDAEYSEILSIELSPRNNYPFVHGGFFRIQVGSKIYSLRYLHDEESVYELLMTKNPQIKRLEPV